MKRDYSLFVKDMISAIESIEGFVKGTAPDNLAGDDKTSSAVIRKFEIIGEAAKHIPSDLKGQYPEIPWKKIVGMRDRMIHAYFGIDYELVWQVITAELPPLKSALRQMLLELEKEK